MRHESGISWLTLLGSMTCHSLTSASTASLVVRNNLGAVVLRESSFWALTYREGVRLMQSDIVVIDRCVIIGGNSPSLFYHAGQGMVARFSNLASFRSSYQGGRGWDVPCDDWHWSYPGGDGGAGYECPDGFLFAGGGSFDPQRRHYDG